MNRRIHTLLTTSKIPDTVQTVLVPGASAGGPDDLVDPLIDLFIDIERRGLNIVLHAHTLDDLEPPVARVCRYVYSSDPGTLEVASQRWGREQVCTDLSELPVPLSRTLRRRIYNALKRRGR